MLRRTLIFASIMENALGATVDLHRARLGVFDAVAALVTGNAMLGLLLLEDDDFWRSILVVEENPGCEIFTLHSSSHARNIPNLE
jgi:hypothetical protein